MKQCRNQIYGLFPTRNLVSIFDILSCPFRQHMLKPMEAITKAIRGVLERTPPELSADLVHQGLTLAGGGALMRGIDRVVSDAVGLPVRIAEDPLTAVARGTGRVLEKLDLLKQILEHGEE